MLENLSLRGFTWRREPVLYVALAVGLLNLVLSVLNGDVGTEDAIEWTVGAVAAFFVRGQVTPYPKK